MEARREYLLRDIKSLNMTDVNKVYRYVRRYCVAQIEELKDPLDRKRKQQITELCKYVIENHEHGGDIGGHAYTLAKGLIDD